MKFILFSLDEEMVFINMSQNLSDMVNVYFYVWRVNQYVIDACNDKLFQHVSEIHWRGTRMLMESRRVHMVSCSTQSDQKWCWSPFPFMIFDTWQLFGSVSGRQYKVWSDPPFFLKFRDKYNLALGSPQCTQWLGFLWGKRGRYGLRGYLLWAQ